MALPSTLFDNKWHHNTNTGSPHVRTLSLAATLSIRCKHNSIIMPRRPFANIKRTYEGRYKAQITLWVKFVSVIETNTGLITQTIHVVYNRVPKDYIYQPRCYLISLHQFIFHNSLSKYHNDSHDGSSSTTTSISFFSLWHYSPRWGKATT